MAVERGGRGLGRFISGDVVVLDFPFSDLSQTKRRPALVIAELHGDDLILCQISSQAREDSYSVRLAAADFLSGGLNRSSYIRPNRVFTADAGVVLYRAGHISPAKLAEAKMRLVSIINTK